MGAEKVIAAEKGNEKIAIEIKSFVRPSAVSEFHAAVGQYMNYRKALGKSEPDRLLYLAVPKETFNSFFTLPFISECIADYNLKLIIYDPVKEAVTAWKK
ncbi:element excision factor XisH family protein [Candidatus Electrothrix sp.]|uniref:element excision factor XisH family protein n=1 Tax=Candidatus Electrothrix sp. TaxID=2170559 RepID=UPI0040571CEF